MHLMPSECDRHNVITLRRDPARRHCSRLDSLHFSECFMSVLRSAADLFGSGADSLALYSLTLGGACR